MNNVVKFNPVRATNNQHHFPATRQTVNKPKMKIRQSVHPCQKCGKKEYRDIKEGGPVLRCECGILFTLTETALDSASLLECVVSRKLFIQFSFQEKKHKVRPDFLSSQTAKHQMCCLLCNKLLCTDSTQLFTHCARCTHTCSELLHLWTVCIGCGNMR